MWLLILIAAVQFDELDAVGPCSVITKLFEGKEEACRCFPPGVGSGGLHMSDDSSENSTDYRSFASAPWIGCSRERMPAIYRALAALPNNTRIQKLWIWDSLIPVVPQKFFGRLMVKNLILESSHVGQFFPGVFKPFASHLRVLILKNNIIYRVDSELFEGLSKLKVLDLSGNQLSQIGASSFGSYFSSLKTLNLNHNNISSIREGAFRHLQELETLSLAFNALTSLEMDSLSGLSNLKHLDLGRNKLEVIPVGAFDHLLHLETLDVGSNRLKALQLPTLPNLMALFLHNNSLTRVEDISLHSPLYSVQSLYLDQNMITKLNEDQFAGFPKVKLLSLASNQLSQLHAATFRTSREIRVLSLQRNRLTDLPSGVFAPLVNLSKLILSENNLTSLDEDTFAGITSVNLLSVSHNRLRTVHRRALVNFHMLEKLYLNDNQLQQLSNESLAQVSDNLYLLDLSDNPWHCNCDAVWLAKWMRDRQEILTNGALTRCEESSVQISSIMDDLIFHCEQTNDTYATMFGRYEKNDYWISVLGIILAIVSLLILAAIAFLFIQDGRLLRQYNELRRIPSDMVTLISSAK
ncbi:LRR 7 and LRR 8 domain containing protein [Trichuris trichiura]|uniref:LRR 7 and LRR 8 domain containing protein n=1 Tax=Trichuris trichiura TaxID=36087 RepID=A0A077Z5F7_TRITR|nr:LRR 7 and LRR 8 domain containing protein [Trichuris trichiura]